jgi:hypothetical protein
MAFFGWIDQQIAQHSHEELIALKEKWLTARAKRMIHTQKIEKASLLLRDMEIDHDVMMDQEELFESAYYKAKKNQILTLNNGASGTLPSSHE